jgi:ADP-ribosylglycohydrolase
MEAVRQNIYQGGDNAGRGQFVAAMMAANAGMSAIPSSWVAQLDPDASEEITRLAALLAQQRAVLDSRHGMGAQQGH